MLLFLEVAEDFSVEFQKAPDRGRDTFTENLQDTIRPKKSQSQSEEIIYLGDAGRFWICCLHM